LRGVATNIGIDRGIHGRDASADLDRGLSDRAAPGRDPTTADDPYVRRRHALALARGWPRRRLGRTAARNAEFAAAALDSAMKPGVKAFVGQSPSFGPPAERSACAQREW